MSFVFCNANVIPRVSRENRVELRFCRRRAERKKEGRKVDVPLCLYYDISAREN